MLLCPPSLIFYFNRRKKAPQFKENSCDIELEPFSSSPLSPARVRGRPTSEQVEWPPCVCRGSVCTVLEDGRALRQESYLSVALKLNGRWVPLWGPDDGHGPASEKCTYINTGGGGGNGQRTRELQPWAWRWFRAADPGCLCLRCSEAEARRGLGWAHINQLSLRPPSPTFTFHVRTM